MSNYAHQTQKLLPDLQKQQHKLRRLASEIKFRLNWTADHVNATCGLNMKTRLRYRQTPSHLYYTAQPRNPCGRQYSLYFAVRSLTAISQVLNHAQSKVRVLLVATFPDYNILWYFWSLIVYPLSEITIPSTFFIQSTLLTNRVGPPAAPLVLFCAWQFMRANTAATKFYALFIFFYY